MGFKSIDEVDRLTIAEYELLMEAHRLKWVDDDYRCHYIAFLTTAASGHKKNGSPVYKKFKNFYDYEKELKKAREYNRGMKETLNTKKAQVKEVK